MNPASIARNVALGSVPLTICSQAASLAAGSGIEARQAAAWRAPASVASRASSAPISGSPAAPRLTSRRRIRQRSSVSTVRPSMAMVPSSRPASSARSSADSATPMNACAYPSWMSEPGSACSMSRRRAPAVSASPARRQAGSV